MANLVIDDQYIPFPYIEESQYVKDVINDDDIDVPILYGTLEEGVEAVQLFGILKELCQKLDEFNNPKEGDTIDSMSSLKEENDYLYSRFKELLDRKNRVYNLLYPVNELVKTVARYENGESVAGWYKNRGLPADLNKAFITACFKGYEDIAIWLYSIGADIHTKDDLAFVYACGNGHETIAKWLYSLGGVDIHVWADNAFRDACGNGHESIARWLHSLGGVDIHTMDDEPFIEACIHGHESIARWLYSLGGINNNNILKNTYHMSFVIGYQKIAYWLGELIRE